MKKTTISTKILSALLLGCILTACNQVSSPVTSTKASQSISPTITPSNQDQNSTDASQIIDPLKLERVYRREARLKELEAILTPDQMEQLQAKVNQGEKLRKAISDLDLTAEQKMKIEIVYEKFPSQTPSSSPDKL